MYFTKEKDNLVLTENLQRKKIDTERGSELQGVFWIIINSDQQYRW